LAKEVKYIPLPAESYARVKARFEKKEKGTAFAGHGDMAVPIGEILDRPLTQ
jgi:hypothetical protein